MFRLLLIMILVSFAITINSYSKPDNSTADSRVEAQDNDNDKDEADYILGTNDVIHIIVEGHPEWSGDFTVRPNGKIVLRDVGEIKVKGLVKNELKDMLAKRLGEYINNPRITIETVQYKSQMIYVLGQVNKPGEYSTEGKIITLKDAVVMAGLPSRFAAVGRVFVVSPSKVRPKQKVINLYRILYRGEMKQNIELQPGDIVYIPQTLLGKLNDIFTAILSPLSTVKVTTGT